MWQEHPLRHTARMTAPREDASGPATPGRDGAASPAAATCVVIGGAPGSGKSSIGRELARRTGAALLDQDTVTNPLVAEIAALTGAGDDLDHPSLRGSVRDARYACLRDTAAEISALGCPVVVVAPFTAELRDVAAWQRFSAGLPGVVLVAVAIDPAEARRRMLSRGSARDAKLAAAPPPAPAARPGEHVDLVLDGALPVDESVARALAALRALGRAPVSSSRHPDR